MNNIQVKALDNHTFQVNVDATQPSVHQVYLTSEYAQLLSNGRIDSASLVRASFAFLLDRETNTSILRTFDLAVIERYFPEYRTKIKEYF
jgi:hypothetical protein